MNHRLIFLILLLMLGNVSADDTNPPYIIAHGMAEKNVKPMLAKIDIELFSYREKSNDALQEINNVTVKIIQILAENDVNEDALEAFNF